MYNRYALYAALFTFGSLCVCDDPTGNGERPAPIPNPKTAYEYFVELSKYPRCSGSEKPASDFLVEFGRARGLDTRRDEALNVLIKKPGAIGRENEPPIILQAHIDMVCKKDDGVEHDFERDPIVPVIADGDWVTAKKRTTLGADDGGGVSMIMAVLAAGGLSHPPIEAVFTTEEEPGLLGAGRFDVSWLSGKRLLNLDMVQEGAIVVGDGHVDGPDIVVPIAIPALMKAAVIPEWPYKPDSPLRDKMVEVYREYYGEDPLIAGLQHAAVECSMFASKMPDADMASIGPDIIDLHTPNERMRLSSYNRVYGYLVRLLESL